MTEDTPFEARGIDYDLEACLDNNPQFGNNKADFTIDDIEQVLAVYSGANDEDDWRWILKLKATPDVFVALQGGCDYTGWDCQSGAWSSRHVSAVAALKAFISDEKPYGYSRDNDERVIFALVRQLVTGRDVTWREKMDKEFGVNSHEAY